MFTLIKKNCHLETAIYRVLNGYDLMLFHKIPIERLSSIIILDEKLKKEPHAFYKSIYEDLQLAFNSIKEKNSLVDLYKDFEDISEFTCQNLYSNNKDYIQKLEEENLNSQVIIENITNNLVKICEFSRISEVNNFRSAYETHFQFIIDGILSLKSLDFSGITNNILSSKYRANVSVFFNYIITFILEITNTIPHKKVIESLITQLDLLIFISHLFFFIFDIIAILVIIFFFIAGINSLCNQIFILKTIFKISEIQE